MGLIDMKKRTDETMGKLLRQREPESATWSFVFYLVEIDDLWNIGICGDYDIQKAFSHFREVCRVKCGYTYSYILHDKDKKQDDIEVDDKPHIHFVVKFNHKVSYSWALRFANVTFGSVITPCDYAEVPYDVEHFIKEYYLHEGYTGTLYPYHHKYDVTEVFSSGNMFEYSYQDFIMIVSSCDCFKSAMEICMQDKKLSKMFVKHCYFVKTMFGEMNNGNNNNN